MSLHNYIEKLRAKPVRERERIAIVATVIGFFIFVGIWIVSFREMNKSTEQPVDQTSASLNDLKNNFQDGKDSIQNMMQQLPSQTGAAGTDAANGADTSGIDNSTGVTAPAPDATMQNPGGNTSGDNNNQSSPDKPGVPQLP